MKKLTFTFSQADQKTRIIGCVALGLAVLAILLLVVSANMAINGSITKLPIIQLAVPEEELNAFDEEYEDLLAELEEAIDNEDEEKLEEFEEDFGISADEMLDMMETVSLNTIKSMSSVLEENDELTLIFTVLIGCITWYAVFLALFVALSALFMNKGFFITSVVLSAGFFFALVGAVWFFVFLALCIAYCILVSKVHTEYIVYKRTPVSVPAADSETATEDTAEAATETTTEDQSF